MPFDKVMSKFKRHTLKSGSGRVITNEKQALAVGMNYEAKKGRKLKPRKKGFTSIG